MYLLVGAADAAPVFFVLNSLVVFVFLGAFV